MDNRRQQVARIRQMERRLVSATAAVKRLSGALGKWETAVDDIIALDRYYGSDVWRQDLADDESGLLPDDLKRGVLSEDGIWNLLADVRDQVDRMQENASRFSGNKQSLNQRSNKHS